MTKRPLGCIALLLACAASASVFAVMYTRPKSREVLVDMRNLVVDRSVFPQGWELEFGPSHPPPGKHLKDEIESVYVQFSTSSSDALATHAVLRYQNDLQAIVSFYMSGEFVERDSVVTSWAVPEGWSYRSSTADRFKLACAELHVLSRFSNCTAVAQYDEYISVFRAHVPSESMTLQDLENILVTIDGRMADCLGEGEE